MPKVPRLPLTLIAAVALAGCHDDLGPASPELESSIFTLLGGLAVGEAPSVSGAQADSIYLAGGTAGAEYVLVPFFAAEGGTARLQVEVEGRDVQTVSAGFAEASRLEAPGRLPDAGFHERLLARSEREISPLLALVPRDAASGAARRSRGPRAAIPAEPGALVAINTATGCMDEDLRYGRVEAVGRGVIVVADTANPAAGLTAADYESVAAVYDDLVEPVLTRFFGEVTDIDGNDRVVIFFTRAVNELTPPNSGSYVGGFFWSGDLVPRDFCPGSNEAEVFYQLAADPLGEVNGNVFPTAFVRATTMGVVGHELQHLINAGRRIYVNEAETFEAGWLNEGLSHIAEELLFLEAAGLAAGQNIDLETLLSTERILDAVNSYQTSNLVRLAIYLQQPGDESLLGVDALETRGATWAFLRYAADHAPGSDEEFFRQLVNSRVSGTENLTRVLGADVVEAMRAWTVSVYTDDLVQTLDPRFQQPSWNFRSIIPVFYRDRRFPLRVESLRSDRKLELRLRGGGAAFVRVQGLPGRPALISTTSGGRTPPDRLRVSVVRTR